MNLRLRLLLDYYLGGLLQAILRVPTILLGKLLRRDHDLSNCREIAILKMLGGGSLVIAYPTLLALRRLPGVRRLTLITTPAIAPFGALLRVFDEIVIVRDNQGLLTLAADSARAFRRFFRHDAVIDLEIHSRLTTVFALLTAARNRIGFFTHISFWRRHLNTHLLFCNVSNSVCEFYDQLALLFGTSPVDSAECERRFRSGLRGCEFEGNTFRLAIAPTCSGLSQERALHREEWGEVVAERIAHRGALPAEFHLLGGPADRAELERMREMLQERFPGVAIRNHAGEASLEQSVRILAAVNEVLCIDSALLHFSRLLGRRTVSYWGPTDPRTLLRPDPRCLDDIHYAKVPCSPCVHVSNQPPCKGRNICMRLAADPLAAIPRNQPWVLQG